MNVNNLITMANQIGDFFESMPNHAEALDGIANHIRRYWAPPMRTAILAELDNADSNISAVVREALEKHKAGLTPVAA